MTQDQHEQGTDPGYVRGDVVTDDDTEDFTEESKPMTRFQKVASALRGGGADRDANQDEVDEGQPAAEAPAAGPEGAGASAAGPEGAEPAAGSGVRAQSQDTAAGGPPWVTEEDEAAMANSPVSREAPAAGTDDAGASQRDYWDEPSGAEEDEPAAVTRPEFTTTIPAARPGEAGPDTTDHAATEPDMPGATAGHGTTTTPGGEGQPGAATIADVPAGGTPATANPADSGLRPGQAAGALGDFSDLTYGDLIPDVAQYTEQWQQIQFRFVDDPQGSVTQAADIIAQVTAQMEAGIQERQRAIEERQRAISEQQRSLRGRWGEGTNTDTEALRETLRMYKTFLDQLIGRQAD